LARRGAWGHTTAAPTARRWLGEVGRHYDRPNGPVKAPAPPARGPVFR